MKMKCTRAFSPLAVHSICARGSRPIVRENEYYEKNISRNCNKVPVA